MSLEIVCWTVVAVLFLGTLKLAYNCGWWNGDLEATVDVDPVVGGVGR